MLRRGLFALVFAVALAVIPLVQQRAEATSASLDIGCVVVESMGPNGQPWKWQSELPLGGWLCIANNCTEPVVVVISVNGSPTSIQSFAPDDGDCFQIPNDPALVGATVTVSAFIGGTPVGSPQSFRVVVPHF